MTEFLRFAAKCVVIMFISLMILCVVIVLVTGSTTGFGDLAAVVQAFWSWLHVAATS